MRIFAAALLALCAAQVRSEVHFDIEAPVTPTSAPTVYLVALNEGEDAATYDELYQNFRWEIPARFNIATACCDRRARSAVAQRRRKGGSWPQQPREPGECRLHKNINLSAGRLRDLLVTRQ